MIRFGLLYSVIQCVSCICGLYLQVWVVSVPPKAATTGAPIHLLVSLQHQNLLHVIAKGLLKTSVFVMNCLLFQGHCLKGNSHCLHDSLILLYQKMHQLTRLSILLVSIADQLNCVLCLLKKLRFMDVAEFMSGSV